MSEFYRGFVIGQERGRAVFYGIPEGFKSMYTSLNSVELAKEYVDRLYEEKAKENKTYTLTLTYKQKVSLENMMLAAHLYYNTVDGQSKNFDFDTLRCIDSQFTAQDKEEA